MKDFEDMTVGELDDHVSAGAVKKYETEINALKVRIEEAEQVVRAKRAQ